MLRAISFATASLLLASALLAAPALADEGFWTFDHVPVADIETKVGVRLTQDWLDRARLGALGGPGFCSSSFVSPAGLVMTNHHCVRGCLQAVSGSGPDYFETGFLAENEAAEVRCPGVTLDQLVDISDVTEKIRAAPTEAAREKAVAEVERGCPAQQGTYCQVVILHQGGIYSLHRYRRFTDVRLVFVAEASVANFGGDPYNFTFPRYAFDIALARVYADGRPLDSSGTYLHLSRAGPRDNEATFVVGKPIWSYRDKTAAEIEFDRDVGLSRDVLTGAELRGHLAAFADRGPEQMRIAGPVLVNVENTYKYDKFNQRALTDPAVLRKKLASETALRSKVGQDTELSQTTGAAWGEIAQALKRYRTIYDRYQILEGKLPYPQAAMPALLGTARDIVRAGEERAKPNEDRLPQYTDARMPALSQSLLAPLTIDDDFEIAKLTFYLTKMSEDLDPNDPVVRQAFGEKSPAELAAFLVHETTLRDVEARKALLGGGAQAVAASSDPLIVFVRDVLDPPAREVRRYYETKIDAVLSKNHRLIGNAQFRLDGTGTYPQATNTLRLSFGKVAGLQRDGADTPAFTAIGGAFERHTGRAPLSLPARWLKAKSELQLEMPLNFIATNDVASGNSGSPMLNGAGEVVGLVFDCNLPSVCGSYAFDEATHRVIAVGSASIFEIMDKVYNAKRIVEELRAPAAPTAQDGRNGK